MVRRTYTPEQIINKLREAEIMLSQGTTLAGVWRKIGVSDCTYYRCRKEYGWMRVDQACRLKDLEQENSRCFTGSVYRLNSGEGNTMESSRT